MKYNHKNGSKNKTLKSRKIRGGGVGTSSFGEFAFGSMNSQTAIEGSSNTIDATSADMYSGNADMYSDKMVVDGVVGGGKLKFGGRGILTDVAIPAILLYANNTIGKRKSTKRIKRTKRTKRIKRTKRKTRFLRINK